MIETFGHGPELPVPIAYHCMIATDYGIYSTGGRSDHNNVGIRADTWFWDKNDGVWQNGPNLIEARHSHACGSFVFENTTILVVTGGTRSNVSTEFLELGGENATWILGK